MAYRVVMDPAADRAVAKLPKKIRARIADRLAALADNPRPPGCLKFSGRRRIGCGWGITGSFIRFMTIG